MDNQAYNALSESQDGNNDKMMKTSLCAYLLSTCKTALMSDISGSHFALNKVSIKIRNIISICCSLLIQAFLLFEL